MNQSKATVFVASIGLGDYIPTTYTDGKQSIQAKFVQNAIRKIFAPDAPAFIFATGKALDTFFPKDRSRCSPLPRQKKAKAHAEEDPLFQLYRQNFYQECERLKLAPPVTIEIKDGKNMQELWEIFDVLCENIEENAKICFDPTHAFRHHPLIMTILFNYLHVVKKTEVVHCEYGAFEANKKGRFLRHHIDSLLEPDTSDSSSQIVSDQEVDCSPLFPLTEFYRLNDWTNAIHDFLEYGRTNALKHLVEGHSRGIDGQDETLRFVNALDRLADYALVSNLHAIEQLDYQNEILNPLHNINHSIKQSNYLPQLMPLFVQVEMLLNQFQFCPTPSWKNGFAMARWCGEFKLYPQLYTILQETCFSAGVDLFLNPEHGICSETALKEAGLAEGTAQRTQRERRDFISVLLGIESNTVYQHPEQLYYPLVPKKKDDNMQSQRIHLGEIIMSNAGFAQIRDAYGKVKAIRNSINHGFTGGQIESCAIQEKADELISSLATLFLSLAGTHGE
jgi:hypothetical protein